MHIHAHAGSQKKHQGKPASGKPRGVSQKALVGILESLRTSVKKLEWKPGGTEWADYYDDTNYSDASLQTKRELVGTMLEQTNNSMVWDLGANNGYFSRVASERGLFTVAADIDPAAVEHNWRACRRGAEPHLLPLLMDLTNPSPALGWSHGERESLLDRGPANTVIALALIHHLAISNNVPLDRLAGFFAAAGGYLIIEFVPKSDSQVKRLLATREDVFPSYHQEGFEAAFGIDFDIIEKKDIESSERTLYLMRRK